jgi:hypothetical protein
MLTCSGETSTCAVEMFTHSAALTVSEVEFWPYFRGFSLVYVRKPSVNTKVT